MKLILKRTLFITLALAGCAFLPKAGAAHATNFLNALQTEVTNRVATTGTNATKMQLKALSSAAKTLNRNTKIFAADLGALASASKQLNAKFTNDEPFAALEAEAVAAYSAEAHAELGQTIYWIGTNHLSKALSNKVVKAQAALDRADASSNNVPAHARALASAFNRIRPADVKIHSLFPAPPVPPFEAPLSLAGQRVTVVEDAIVNERTSFYFNGNNGTYVSDNPEELGIWTYQRTNTTTGVITLMSNYPVGDYAQRPMTLTFTNATSGTFTGTDFPGTNIYGVFTVEPQP